MLGSALHARLSVFHEVLGRGRTDVDISSEEACRRSIEDCKPDLVINAAAYTNVDGCESAPEQCFSVNALGVKNIALACQDRAVKIIHFSTDYVFDGKKGQPYREEDPCHPLNTYGLSKYEGERFLQAYAENYLIIRTSWLYGRCGRNFVSTILEKARSAEALYVVNDQVGSPTSATDIADAVERLARMPVRGIVHITNSGQCSWFDFARKILRYGGAESVSVCPLTSDALARPARRPPFSVLDCSKFTALSGTAMRSWDEALRDYLRSEGLYAPGGSDIVGQGPMTK